MCTKKLIKALGLIIVVALLAAVLPMQAKAEGETVIPVYVLSPSWDAVDGGGVFSAYVAPPYYGYVSPGSTGLYQGKEAGIIKAGITHKSDGHYDDEGLFGFIPNVTINALAAGPLTYDVIAQAGVNPVWMTIELDTEIVGDRSDNTTYQFVPTTNPEDWHTVNAATGYWQKWNNNQGDTSGNPLISLSQVAINHPGVNVVRVYLRLGMGDSYYNNGTGTINWVDKVQICNTIYDFQVKNWYVAPTGDDENLGTPDNPFATIQHAIDVASDGDTVNVAAGTYAENLQINKAVNLLGLQNTRTFDSVVIGAKAPNVWYVDRYAPAVFESFDFEGRKVLRHGVLGSNHQDSSFYNYQGRKLDVNLTGPTITVSIDLFVGSDWGSKQRNAGFWATGLDSSNAISAYPMIAWRSGGTDVAGFYAFDYFYGGWDLLHAAEPEDYGKWHNLVFTYNVGEGVSYFIDGDFKWSFSDSYTTQISNIILNVYNFGENYDVYWDNLTNFTNEAKVTGLVNISAANVVVDGFTLENPGQPIAVDINSTANNVALKHNVIQTVGGPSVGQMQAVYLEHGPDNVLIEGNTFKDISSGTSSAKAILSGDSNTTDAATGLKIRANTFSNISALRGAYGVILNNGAGNPGAIIEANAFNGLSGAWTHAIGLEGPTENAKVENNAFAGLTATSPDNSAIFFEDNSEGGSVAVKYNKFFHSGLGVGIHPDDQPGGANNFNYTVDASPNWWGSVSGPVVSTQIFGSVTYDPWCGDAECSFLNPNYLPDDVTADGIQAAIDDAHEGEIIVIPAGTYNQSGGFTIGKPGVTIRLTSGAIIQNSSPCFVINASYTKIYAEPGAKCIPTGGANGINVAENLVNIVIDGLEITGIDPANSENTSGDGIHFDGVVTDVLLVDNYIHDLDGNGVFFGGQPGGLQDIHGNLFQNNFGNGIEAGTFIVDATYNSWGSYAGPASGDGVSSNVNANPWTHADITVAPVITNTTSRVVTSLANVTGRPTVLKDGNVYHMWYGTDDTHLYHTSSTNPAEFPVGVETTFDTKPLEVASPAIIKEADGFKMIAYGADNSEFALYTSANGNTWTKGLVVFDGTGKFGTDFVKVDAPFLFKTETGYRLYFQVKTGSSVTERYNIYAADSTTIGGTYALANGGNPVLSPAASTTAWDGKYVMHPWVVKEGDTYYMWFSAHNDTNQRIGVATSTNGLVWTKSAANPVIGPVGEPAVIKDGSIWRIWYLAGGNKINYLTALNPLDLRQTLAYQVTANLQNVIAADVTLNFPASLLSIAEITPGPAFNSVTLKTTPDGSIQFIGAKLREPVEPVTGQNVVLFTVAFHTDTQGSGDIAFGPATFGMPGAGSSSNVYLAASADTASAQVNELPTLSTTFGDVYYLVGDPQTFKVVITNEGTAYPNAQLRLGVPTGVALTLDSTGGYSLSGGVVALGQLDANEEVTLTFSATISSAGAKTISFDVYDASSLLFSTVETATVYTKPVISSTNITGPYQQGVPQDFIVNVNNVDSMYTPNSFTLHFNFPEGTTLVFGDVTYSCGISGCDVPVTLAVPNNALTFTVTFNAAWNAPATITLIDGQVDPDRTLAMFTTTTNVVVYANITSVTGTVSMQGRTYRGGVLFTLTGGFGFGPYNATSIDQMSNNVAFANLASGSYTISVTQARYLEVPAALSKTINIGSDTSITALVLRGGDVQETGAENNVINVNDASLIGTWYGQSITDTPDANFDGKVNILDLALVGGNFGLTSATAYDTEWMP